jgi:RimJ/RimL family protein N-acetyltransferase
MTRTNVYWPLFDLVVKTPRLQLRYATDDLLLELCDVAGDVLGEGPRPFDGNATFYDRTVTGRRRWLAGQWSARARCSPSWWVLVFAVVVDGHAVGTQEITGVDFPLVRTIDSFSWLTRAAQGEGIGKEMRAAALHLAFDGLGAERANSDAFEDNARSLGVSRALAYEPNGTLLAAREGEVAPMSRLLLTREAWLARRRTDLVIEGLEPAKAFLGLGGGMSGQS